MESGNFLSVFIGHWAVLYEYLGSPQDLDHHRATEIGNSFVLPVETFNDKSSFNS